MHLQEITYGAFGLTVQTITSLAVMSIILMVVGAFCYHYKGYEYKAWFIRTGVILSITAFAMLGILVGTLLTSVPHIWTFAPLTLAGCAIVLSMPFWFSGPAWNDDD